MSILFSWLSPLRAICMAIDGVLYSLLDNAYDLVIKLSTAELLKPATIKSLTGNLYIIFGVVAFFRLALLLVNAIIDPEKLNEKGKGLSNIFFRVVGMVILLAVTPFLFEKSYDLQEKIVGADASKNIIFKTILGNNANIASSNNSNAGKALQNIALSSLITIDENYLKNASSDDSKDKEKVILCKYKEIKDDNGKVKGYDYTKITNSDEYNFCPLVCVPNGDGTCTPQGGYVYDGSTCDWTNCQNAVDTYNEMYVNEDMSPSKLASYVGVSKKIEDENGEKQEVYVYNYMFIITGVVGVAMTYIIISFAIDIAVRMFELIVLEILSPLFIATFVDPKSAQSGPFKNWLSAVGKSYASLYIRLAIIALMVLLVSIINQSKMFQSMGDVSGWAKIFMVIGLLIFAKKAPKWIGDMIGIKGDVGLGGLSIGKKLGGMALAGGLASKGLEAAKNGIKKGARALGGSALSSLGATSASRRIARDKQKAQGSLKDRYKSERANGKTRGQALGSYFNEGAKRMKERAVAGIEGGKYGAKEGLKNGANTKNAGEMAALLGKTYSGMTKEAGHEGIKDKVTTKFDEATAKAKIKAFGVSTSDELRKISENSEKIRKANKYRNAGIGLDSSGKRKDFDFQNGIEMNKAAQIASSNEPGFNLNHDPISENEVYMADMINNGLASRVTMDASGNISSFVDNNGNVISGDNVSKALTAYGANKFSMCGRDQIAADCGKNAQSTQSTLIEAKAKVTELETASSNLSVNLSKLNMDKATIMGNSNMNVEIPIKFKKQDGTIVEGSETVKEAYEKYLIAKERGNASVASIYETALKQNIPDQFTALQSIDTSIRNVEEQKRNCDEDAKAWKAEADKNTNILVEFCKKYADSPKDNPLANPDNVTLVGSYEKDSNGKTVFVENTDKSKVYSKDAAIQNTQTKVSKLEEKAKASYEAGKESSDSN